MTVGEGIKAKREELGMTQSKLARKSDVPRQLICMYEKNKAMPGLIYAVSIADVLGVSLDYLAGRDRI